MRRSVVAVAFLLGASACQDGVGSQGGEGYSDQPDSSVALADQSPARDASAHDMSLDLPTSSDDGGSPDLSEGVDLESAPDMVAWEGEWRDVERFTIIPRAERDHGTRDERFCRLASYSNTIAVVRIIEKGERLVGCSNDPYNPYRVGFTRYKIKQLLHVGGERLPQELDLVAFRDSGSETMKSGKTYITGLLEIDGAIYSHGNHLEIVEYDPTMESERVMFSGKRESLISMAQTFIDERPESCFRSGNYYSKEDFKKYFLVRDDDFCAEFGN